MKDTETTCRISQPKHMNWETETGMRRKMGRIGKMEGLTIRLRGRADGRRKMVSIDSQGVVASAFCTLLMEQTANDIGATWAAAGNAMDQISPFLKQEQSIYDRLNGEREQLADSRDGLEERAALVDHPADMDVSPSTQAKRQAFRRAKATAATDARMKEIDVEFDKIRSAVAVPLTDYYGRENAAVFQEDDARRLLAQRIAIYAHAALTNLSEEEAERSGYITAVQVGKDAFEYHWAHYRRFDFGIDR